MNRSGKKVLHTAIAMFLMAVIVVGAFFLLNHRDSDSDSDQSQTVLTEVEKLLAKDLDHSYPGTPREVLKLYSRILKCFYSGTMSDSQIEQMAGQIRKLFDEELLASNPEREYLEDLKTEIEEYQSLKKTIMSYVIEKSSSVEKSTVEGKEYATILATYLVKEGTSYEKTYEEFMLREDEKGHWKILGWRLVQPTEVEDEDV